MRESKFDRIQLDGGCHAFDFTNTINNRTIQANVDYVKSYDDVILWLYKTSLLPKKRIKMLSQLADKNKEDSDKAFKKVILVREILYNLFSPIAKRKNPEIIVQEEFNKILATSFSKMRLSISSLEPQVSFVDNDVSFDEPIRIIMKSAYDILTTEKMERVKECPACGWLFIDRTKNGKRRWCNMNVCGSNDKAKRYYHRKKKTSV